MNPLEKFGNLLVDMFESDMNHFSMLFGGEWWQMLLGLLYIVVFVVKWIVITMPLYVFTGSFLRFTIEIENDSSDKISKIQSVLKKHGDN